MTARHLKPFVGGNDSTSSFSNPDDILEDGIFGDERLSQVGSWLVGGEDVGFGDKSDNSSRLDCVRHSSGDPEQLYTTDNAWLGVEGHDVDLLDF
jgi:hypothetical protein